MFLHNVTFAYYPIFRLQIKTNYGDFDAMQKCFSLKYKK